MALYTSVKSEVLLGGSIFVNFINGL